MTCNFKYGRSFHYRIRVAIRGLSEQYDIFGAWDVQSNVWRGTWQFLRNSLPDAEEFPPGAADDEPDRHIEEARREADGPPVAYVDKARSVENSSGAASVVGQPAEKGAEEAEGVGGKIGRRADFDGDHQKCGEHGADMGYIARE